MTSSMFASGCLRRCAYLVAGLVLACHPPASNQPQTGEDFTVKARDALVGRPAPAVTLEGLDGERVALRDLAGKPVYLKFWATWCKPCRAQMPHLEAAYHKYGDQIAVYAIDLGLNDPIETVRAFRAELGLTVPFVIDADGRLAEQFDVSVTPQHILIDRAGVVRYVGHAANAALDRAIEALLHDAPSPAESRAARPDPAAAELPALHLLGGSSFALGGHAGRPVALTFILDSCDTYFAKSRPAMAQACAAHAHQIEALRAHRDRVDWVLVAHPVWTSPGDLDDYRKRLGVTAPIGLDEGARWFHRFRVRDVPTTIVLDGNGAEVARVTGPGDDLASALAKVTTDR